VSDPENVAVADGGRLKDDTNDVVGMVVAGRLAAGLDATYELRRQQAAVAVEVHRLPLLLLQQHVRHVLVPVDCPVAVRVHLLEDLHRHASVVFIPAMLILGLKAKFLGLRFGILWPWS